MGPKRPLILLLLATASWASESVFSVHDDVLAFPQYDIVFSESFIHHEVAQAKLDLGDTEDIPPAESAESGELARIQPRDTLKEASSESGKIKTRKSYERLVMNGRPYFCTTPYVERQLQNRTEAKPTEAEQQKEFARATSRGWELLQDMQGKPCLFYTTGWWSYSFCYNQQVKQFHSLPPGQNGAPLWPPKEDPMTPTYILGKIDPEVPAQKAESGEDDTNHEVELQRKAETSYLVQRFEGGTPCDLTGQDRKIEIQFHCNPQTTDRIGWIKETATCAYLMVVYTPRLCNDMAFLPPKESSAHPITCQEILHPDEVEDWKKNKANEASRKLIDTGAPQRIMIGSVEVGAMKDVGREGKKIERGRVVLTPEEKAETVVTQKDGRMEGLSAAALRKMDLDPEDVEAFTKELQKLAGSKDWKIERLDDANGQVQLRGIVASESDEKTAAKPGEKKAADPEVNNEEGSEEEYKEEI